MGRLKTAAKSGNNIRMLKTLQNMLAERLENTKSDRDFASLSRQLVQVSAEIQELENAESKKTTSLSEMRAKLKVVSG